MWVMDMIGTYPWTASSSIEALMIHCTSVRMYILITDYQKLGLNLMPWQENIYATRSFFLSPFWLQHGIIWKVPGKAQSGLLAALGWVGHRVSLFYLAAHHFRQKFFVLGRRKELRRAYVAASWFDHRTSEATKDFVVPMSRLSGASYVGLLSTPFPNANGWFRWRGYPSQPGTSHFLSIAADIIMLEKFKIGVLVQHQ